MSSLLVLLTMQHVFVYGSLRAGFHNNFILKDETYQGIYKTTDNYYMIGVSSGAYPYVVKEKVHPSLKETPITGELYVVRPETIEILDRLEGHPSHYTRSLVEITNGTETVTAFMYICVNPSIVSEIQEEFEHYFCAVNSGDWQMFHRENPRTK